MSANAQVPVVVLAQGRTKTEKVLIRDWVAKNHRGAPIADLGGDTGVDTLADDTLLVPVRVTWLSVSSNSRRPTELLAHLSPRRPPGPLQGPLLRNSPGRAGVVKGEPATVGELRERFAQETGNGSSFATFVARAATVAVDRSERRLIGDRYKVPRQVVEQITASSRFRAKIEELAAKLGKSDAEVLAEAQEALNELVTVQSPAAIDAFRTVLSPMHSRAWKVQVDTSNLDRLRGLNKEKALVFLPAHRSYVDPLVLAEVLHEHDFPRNHMLGGNNMSFWPIGPLGKRAGVIFIRRASDNAAAEAIYKFALREYLGYLTGKKFNLEWYIEGGRTRTGKLRPPKLGLLAYLVRALQDDLTDDVAMVPVSIVYDHMQEVRALDAEQGGAAKAAESTRWLARYVRGQQRMSGNAWVRFGEPFSLREALAQAGEGPAQLDKVGFKICDGINRTTPVTSSALLTFTLLGSHDRALTLPEVGRVLAPLLDYLDTRGIPRTDTEASLREEAGLRKALDRLVAVGVATMFDGGPEPVWSIQAGQHRVAAFYRNGALHHLVARAITELALLQVSSKSVTDSSIAEAWAEAQRLRDLLKFEFFFPPTEQFRQDVLKELELLDPNWESQEGPDAGAKILSSSGLLLAHRTLRSFLDAQIVVATALAERDPAIEVVEGPFGDQCLGLGKQMLLRGRLHRADSVSRELYTSALRLARNRGLLETSGTEAVQAARHDFLAEVTYVLERLSRIDRLEADLLEEVLG
ncbi:glycerol-3-phosphate 1-O-acyltransferase [Sporichthya sp.]|uniref:glycerol-3-phosphate 1-O-acyltransferase n=1 Tax=Sporichthya sp. TaxID=65475 RepID=UPI001822EE9F|nr:glycerol-3-phosphate 1-O-acyltransferase [Sporichthya sp.]MBA3742994.1 glycerol-3-phosphate 1-O-acyltransferase [Sporichthya sp.]